MSHGLFYRCPCCVSGPGNISVDLLSMGGLRALGFNQKHLNLCSEDERRSYWLGTTWGWVINGRILISGWTNPSSMYMLGESGVVLHVQQNTEWSKARSCSLSKTMRSSKSWNAAGFQLHYNPSDSWVSVMSHCIMLIHSAVSQGFFLFGSLCVRKIEQKEELYCTLLLGFNVTGNSPNR